MVKLEAQKGYVTVYCDILLGCKNVTMFLCNSTQLRGLYKGLTPPLLGQVAINAVVFSTQEATMRVLKKMGVPEGLAGFVSGVPAGFVQCFICCPMELVKLRMQHMGIEEKTPTLGLMRDTCRPIWKTHGLRGFFQGMVPTVWRETTGFGMYFGTYYYVKNFLNSRMLAEKQSAGREMVIWSIAGAFAGVAAWLNYPLDTFKTRIQMDGVDGNRIYRGMWDCVRKTWNDGGMWKGFTPALARAFVWSAACFPAYELTKRWLTRQDL